MRDALLTSRQASRLASNSPSNSGKRRSMVRQNTGWKSTPSPQVRGGSFRDNSERALAAPSSSALAHLPSLTTYLASRYCIVAQKIAQLVQ
jgi:hypothetical protein